MSKEQLQKATHQGELKLGENAPILPCAVLQDGTRVISKSAIFKALGRTKRGRNKGEIRVPNMPDLPSFIDANNLQPFISQELREVLNGVDYISKNGTINSGYEAIILPLLCDVYLEARKKEKLTKSQLPLAVTSEILVRSLSKIGIIALVDEATGYQYDREKDALSVVLKALISDEILAYQKQFQLSFYKEIFRLWNIPFTPENIARKPQFIGHITNRYVYSNMPKGSFVLEELKKKTPKNEKGKYKVQFHRSLTELGKEHLKKVLYSVEALASISDDKKAFDRVIQNKYGQKEIPFNDLDRLDKPTSSPKIKLNKFDKNLEGLLSVPPPQKEQEKE